MCITGTVFRPFQDKTGLADYWNIVLLRVVRDILYSTVPYSTPFREDLMSDGNTLDGGRHNLMSLDDTEAIKYKY
jgi:hypothetical protein